MLKIIDMENEPNKISEITLLAAFCSRHKISRQQLSDIAGGDANDASKSTIQRLLHNQIEDADYAARLRLILAENLPSFLLSRGMNAANINNELTQIFKGKYKPMVTEKIELTAAAQKWFNLSDDPFGINLKSVADVFVSPELQQIFDRVLDAIKYQGFVAVTGDIGTGKTVLRLWLEEYLLNNNHLKLIIPDAPDMSKVSPASIARAILEDFDYGTIPIDAVSRSKAVKRLLAEKREMSVALLFDECHRLDPKTLTSLKNFLEMNSGGFRRFLGVILFGQTSFDVALTKSREIKERLTVLKMPDFEKSAIEYLAHRLKLVGGRIDDIFDQDALDIIALNAKTPLQLGNIVNKAMLESMKSPYESKRVLGGIIRATMTLVNTKTKRSLQAVG